MVVNGKLLPLYVQRFIMPNVRHKPKKEIGGGIDLKKNVWYIPVNDSSGYS